MLNTTNCILRSTTAIYVHYHFIVLQLLCCAPTVTNKYKQWGILMTSTMQTWSSFGDKQCRAIKHNRICKTNFIYKVLKTITVSTNISDVKSDATACCIFTYMYDYTQPCDSSHCPVTMETQPTSQRWTCISPSSGQSSKISLSTAALKSSNNKHKLSMGMYTHEDIIINNKCYYFTSLF